MPFVISNIKDKKITQNDVVYLYKPLLIPIFIVLAFCIQVLTLFYSCNFPGNSDIYNKIKAFAYKLTDFQVHPVRTKAYKRYGYGLKWVGIGQFKEGTNDLHGAGIQVDELGNIQEGYWKDGKQNGQGRAIEYGGDFCTGEFTADKYNGQGTYWWRNGRKYVGQFKDGKRCGQGTQYTKEAEIERQGEWDDDVEVWYW